MLEPGLATGNAVAIGSILLPLIAVFFVVLLSNLTTDCGTRRLSDLNVIQMMKRELFRAAAKNHSKDISPRLSDQAIRDFHNEGRVATPHHYWQYLSHRLRTCARELSLQEAVRAFWTPIRLPVDADGVRFRHRHYTSKDLMESSLMKHVGIATFDPTRDQEQVYLYTFGIRRKVVDLLVAAYRIACRAGGSGKVGAQELLLAYRSELYVTHREDVEVLFRQRVSGQMESATLWCPFGTMDPVRSNVREAAKIVQAFEKRMEDALLEAALMPAEAAALAVIEPDVSSTAKPAKVFRFRRGRATKDDLLAGAAVLDGID